jgi:hypothetical protein
MLAAAAGMAYPDLIGTIVGAAARRWGLTEPQAVGRAA